MHLERRRASFVLCFVCVCDSLPPLEKSIIWVVLVHILSYSMSFVLYFHAILARQDVFVDLHVTCCWREAAVTKYPRSRPKLKFLGPRLFLYDPSSGLKRGSTTMIPYGVSKKIP